MKKSPVVIRGQKVGRLRASWLLFKESWRFFRSDSEMIWIPLVFCAMNLVLLAFIFGVSVLVWLSLGMAGESEVPGYVWYIGMFTVYAAAAFSVALSQAAVVHTVATRARGGDATLSESLRAAFSFSGTLFVWALITSTVGIILHYLAERSQLLGKIVAWVLGTAWSVLTYFVVTAVVLEKQTAFPAIKRSGAVFRSTWGETFVSNISLGLVFMLAHAIAIVLFIGAIVLGVLSGWTVSYIVAFVLLIIWFSVAAVVYEVLHAVLKTLLYMYATEQSLPANFDQELLSSMLGRQREATTLVTPTDTTAGPAVGTSSYEQR